jgi:HD-GYP domain-containing protein (c-di-GMP phosphodiesterase class II)
MEGFEVSWADTPTGKGPTGNAIRTGAVQVFNDLTTSADFLPWLEKAQANGLASSASVPIHVDGDVIGVLTVYSDAPGAFGDDEIRLLEELAGDIAFGINTRRTDRAYQAGILELAQQATRLRSTFESAIGALAATVEQRDPYTAGHQRRVAQLAVEIGRKLGLEDERLAGLRIAGAIHDIGKISIPAEILSRPGKLSRTEFELIKTHSQVGRDIIVGVDFPWPVAETIYQHHERLDGSGYPRGLKGDEIILEARILAVADMVEAMSSHRPYRPGLGIDTALAQIRQDAGAKLDPQIVDACERLFREQGFTFAQT